MNANLQNEKINKRLPILCLLCFSFFFIYFIPQIGMTQFRWRKEALYTAISLEMNLSRPNTIAHGELISETYPLFPIFASIFLKAGIPVSSATRIVSILFILAISVGIWITAKRAFGEIQAFVSAAIFFSSLIVFDKGMEGYPESTAFFWLFVAWGTWFSLGIQRSLWNIAWFLSFTFCGLSFYTIGWEALFYFFIPLVFMRRPLSIWSRINKAGFYVGVVVLAFFVIIWSYPRWIDGHDIPFRNISKEFTSAYLLQLIFFPFDFFLRLFPWFFIVWTVFCAEYDEMERNPVFTRYLKTIFFTLFFINWFLPNNDPRKYSLVFIPLAILAGARYPILVRRHSLKINNYFIWLTRILIILSFSSFLFYLLPNIFIKNIIPLKKILKIHSDYWFYGTIQTSISLLICIYIEKMYRLKKLAVFKHILLFATAIMLLYWAVMIPYRSQDNYQKIWAEQIKQAMGKDFNTDQIIYETSDVSGDFYGVISYLGCKAKRIKKGLHEIPNEPETVYLISTDVPIMPDRLWTEKLVFKLNNRPHSLWIGLKINKPTATNSENN